MLCPGLGRGCYQPEIYVPFPSLLSEVAALSKNDNATATVHLICKQCKRNPSPFLIFQISVAPLSFDLCYICRLSQSDSKLFYIANTFLQNQRLLTTPRRHRRRLLRERTPQPQLLGLHPKPHRNHTEDLRDTRKYVQSIIGTQPLEHLLSKQRENA